MVLNIGFPTDFKLLICFLQFDQQALSQIVFNLCIIHN